MNIILYLSFLTCKTEIVTMPCLKVVRIKMSQFMPGEVADTYNPKTLGGSGWRIA